MKIVDRVRRRLARNNPKRRAIRVGAGGAELFDQKSGEVYWSVLWQDVEEIVAFKVDAITIDHLCLGFRANGQTVLHVTDEDTPGWGDLNKGLESAFGIRFEEWFEAVAFPAFAENRTVLWQRPAS